MKEAHELDVLESGSIKNSSESQGRHRVDIRNRLPLIGQGLVGALISSFCCLLPAVVIAIGLTGGLAATLASLGRFRVYGIIAGLAFVAIASWLSLRRSRSCCTDEEYKRRQITIPLTMLASFGVVYGLTMYLIIPMLYKIG